MLIAINRISLVPSKHLYQLVEFCVCIVNGIEFSLPTNQPSNVRRQNWCSFFLASFYEKECVEQKRWICSNSVCMFSFLFLSLFAYNNWGRDKKGEENEEKNVSNCIPAYNNVLKYHILCFCKTFPCLLYNFMQEQQQVHMFGIGFYVGAIISLVRCFPFVSFFFSTLIVQCSFLYLFRLETNVFAHTYNLINNIDNGAASASECHLMFNQSASLLSRLTAIEIWFVKMSGM